MKMKNFIEKTADWLKTHQLALIYFVFALVIEMVAVFAVEGSALMSRPFLLIGLLIFFTGGLLAIPNNRIRLLVGTLLLVAQTVIDLIFAALFDMTGQTFEFSLLSLRNDAVAALEKIPVNFLTFYMGLFCCAVFVIYGLRLTRETGKIKTKKYSFFFYVGLALSGVATLGISLVTYYPSRADKYKEMIEGKSASAYASYGMIGNLVGEVFNTARGDKSTMTNEQIESFIYKAGTESQPTAHFGISKDKNVVMVLAESFEWYAMLRNDEYPNALNFTDEQLAALYPNLTQFYNESVIMTNYHSREKTDIAETLSILGSYPTEKYISYDYHENTMPNTVPNILKITEDEEMQMRSFHNGDKEFYNRIVTHKSFGLEGLTDLYDMADVAKLNAAEGEEPTFTDYTQRGELCLDAEMIETCKDMMFPTDKRFYTYITTITMHGVYYARNNLTDVRAEVAEVLGTEVPDEEDVNATNLFHYMVTAKEFDNALGLMCDDLKTKGLWDNTVIMLYGDHNAYYNELTNYVKNIDDYETENNFTDLYKVPLMIRDSDLLAKMKNGQQLQKINKFTCTSDLVPTLLDMLGIRYYTNMFYGHSVFSDEVSVLYSRAYDIFVSDGIVGKSVEKIVFPKDDVRLEALRTSGEMNAYRTRAVELVEKIKYCDYIFKQDYFADEAKYKLFEEKMKALNGLA